MFKENRLIYLATPEHPSDNVEADTRFALNDLKRQIDASIRASKNLSKLSDDSEPKKELVSKFEALPKWDIESAIIDFKAQGLTHESIAQAMIEADRGFFLAKYLEQLPNLDHHKIALELIKKRQVRGLLMYLEKFKVDNPSLALKLCEAGFGGDVLARARHFRRGDKVMKLAELEEMASKYTFISKLRAAWNNGKDSDKPRQPLKNS